jgi:hypothetical protein
MIRRNIFTGQTEEVPSEGGGRRIIARTSVPEGAVDPCKRASGAWSRTMRGQALAVHPDQAGQFSEEAAKAGTGAYYDTQGKLCADSEGALQREFARRGFYDKNAGFRDQSRKGYEEAAARAIETDPYNVSPIWGYRR